MLSKFRFVALPDIWGHAAEERDMKKILPWLLVIIALAFVIPGGGTASSQDKQDKYSLKVPGGLAFSDFKGYEAQDAKCGAACHTLAASKDYIFTTYPKR
jgi:hypothetical protein